MKDILKKWWFWLIALAITIVLGITVIMGIALNLTTKGIHEVARKVQSIDSEATVYSSAGGNTIIIDIPNYSDDTKKYKEKTIEMLLKGYADKNGILSNYSKAILCERINSSNDNTKDYILAIKVYKLPDMTIEENEGSVYVDLVENTKISSENASSTNSSTTEQKGEDIVLTAGKYTVGTDIKAGKYDVIAQSDSGNFFVHGSTTVNEILSAKNDGFGIPKYSNLNLKNGDEVEIRNGLSVKLQAK